ncbi:MAG: maleylpyruvate isomerase [Alcanivorax sp.]
MRIALNLKGLNYDYLPVNLLAMEQKSEEYVAHNPQGLVPALDTGSGEIIAQSGAILEWLEETVPEPALLPAGVLQRSHVRSMVNNIACDVHPLLNIAILKYLKNELHSDKDQIHAWYQTWIDRAFHSVEQFLVQHSGQFCYGDHVTLADCYLVPQVYNAQRFNISMDHYPRIMRVTQHCNTLTPFVDAQPEQQPDAPT